MTNLEITKLAAEAMGYRVDEWDVEHGKGWWSHLPAQHGVWYNPLHDDAQAMALVKKLRPANLSYNIFAGKWSIHTLRDPETGKQFEAFDSDLNRAICECVARMQEAKHG